MNSEFTAEFFDESSKAWMANKRRVGHSMVYICTATTKTGNACKNRVVSLTEFCSLHTPRSKCKQRPS